MTILLLVPTITAISNFRAHIIKDGGKIYQQNGY
jgi:hypothetical protein